MGAFLRDLPETGMGYWVITVVLKDRRQFDQAVVIDSGHLAQIHGRKDIPFGEEDIAEMRVTHDQWSFNEPAD